MYEEVKISKAKSLETPHARLSSECVAWLQAHKTAGLVEKKFALFEDAQQRFGAGLTHVIFDAAYLSVFGFHEIKTLNSLIFSELCRLIWAARLFFRSGRNGLGFVCQGARALSRRDPYAC